MFQNRAHAGKQLAKTLKQLKLPKKLTVLGLPRGGVVVAYEVAKALNTPLDIIICRKLGAPGHEEFALGAIAEGGGTFLDELTIDALNISKNYINETIKREQQKIRNYQKAFRNHTTLITSNPSRRPAEAPSEIEGAKAGSPSTLITDDGAATGYTMMAAIDATKKLGAKKIIVALPVAPPDTAAKLKNLCDQLIVLQAPADFRAVGQFYANFEQVETEDVVKTLKEFRL